MADIDWWGHRPLLQWIANGERGVSSETIVSHLTGVLHRRYTSHPYDPDDFRRCELLLEAVPLLRLFLPNMADVSLQWAQLIERWEEISAVCAEEVEGWPHATRHWTAPRGYQAIKECMRAAGSASQPEQETP